MHVGLQFSFKKALIVSFILKLKNVYVSIKIYSPHKDKGSN